MVAMTERINVAVVGAGRMGRHHARIYSQHPQCRLAAVVDKDLERAKALAAEFGGQVLPDIGSLPADVQAATVAVPTVYHADVAIPLLPGIGTPTEAMAAAERGYSFLKFFPAEALGGAPVLKAFASPLPDITFCPTGGIDPEKAKTYLALPNVICVGGSWIMPADALASGDFARVEALAKEASALRG